MADLDKLAKSQFYGMSVRQVEPGTKIGPTGEEIEVTDKNCVFFGSSVYLTETTYVSLRNHLKGQNDD